MARLNEDEIWRLLEDVKDPEIPVVSVVEMGIIRAVAVDGPRVVVAMTPTFAGCPALHTIREEIESCLQKAGAGQIEVKTRLTPPWTSDWITADARRKLKEFGLAPPPQREPAGLNLDASGVVLCPYCDSSQVTLKNSFGPTLCRAIYYCENCRQPFEQFKPL